MINVNFTIDYPWPNNKFKTLFYRAWKMPIRYKFFEIQVVHDYTDLVCFDFHWKLKGDHAGIRLGLGLSGYQIMFELYDTRHWNYDSDGWEK
jgi:hypothetical protein